MAAAQLIHRIEIFRDRVKVRGWFGEIKSVADTRGNGDCRLAFSGQGQHFRFAVAGAAGTEIMQTEHQRARQDHQVIMMSLVDMHASQGLGTGGDQIPLYGPEVALPGFPVNFGEAAAAVVMRCEKVNKDAFDSCLLF